MRGARCARRGVPVHHPHVRADARAAAGNARIKYVCKSQSCMLLHPGAARVTTDSMALIASILPTAPGMRRVWIRARVRLLPAEEAFGDLLLMWNLVLMDGKVPPPAPPFRQSRPQMQRQGCDP